MSRAARGANEQFLEAYGSQGALVYRLDREKPKWYVGELRAAGASGTLQPVPFTAGLPRSAGEGDQMEVTGKATIAPLVKRFLEGIRKGESPSPSLEDGVARSSCWTRCCARSRKAAGSASRPHPSPSSPLTLPSPLRGRGFRNPLSPQGRGQGEGWFRL